MPVRAEGARTRERSLRRVGQRASEVDMSKRPRRTGVLPADYRASVPRGQLCEFLTRLNKRCANPAHYFVDDKYSCSRDHRRVAATIYGADKDTADGSHGSDSYLPPQLPIAWSNWRSALRGRSS